MDTKKMVLDSWKSGHVVTPIAQVIGTKIKTAIQPIKARIKQNKMIKDYVNAKIDKDEQGWRGMDRSENNIMSEKKSLDKKIKDKLRRMGSY